LPGRGLPLARLHQILGNDDPAATAFAALIAGRLAERRQRPVLWLPAGDDLYPPGLTAWGLTPDRLLVARTGDETARLWAMEQALRCSALACVTAETRTLSDVAGRRLRLAASAGQVTGLLLHPPATGAANAGHTRWRLTSAPRGDWTVILERCRGGRPGTWTIAVTNPDRTVAPAAPV
jgi:protein ImuA